jgi:hypothetical protein
MKVFIVTAQHIKGHAYIVSIGNKILKQATKDRAEAEKLALEKDGHVYSLLIDDGLRLTSRKASNIIYAEARKLGAI